MELLDLLYTSREKDILPFLGRGLLTDSGPLYLRIVGIYDNIRGTNLLRHLSYTLEDFDKLDLLLSDILNSNKLIITPHIFTEFMSHLWKATKSNRRIIPEIINPDGDIDILSMLSEMDVSKDAIRSHRYTTELEIGDLSLYIAQESYKINAILSDDATFSNFFVRDDKTLIVNFGNFKKYADTLPREWN